jgi:hypothetical protein
MRDFDESPRSFFSSSFCSQSLHVRSRSAFGTLEPPPSFSQWAPKTPSLNASGKAQIQRYRQGISLDFPKNAMNTRVVIYDVCETMLFSRPIWLPVFRQVSVHVSYGRDQRMAGKLGCEGHAAERAQPTISTISHQITQAPKSILDEFQRRGGEM